MNTLINWFEIPVADLAHARMYYEAVLVTEYRQENVAGIDMAIFPCPEFATGGALVKGPMFTPSAEGVVVYLSTADIDAALQRLRQAGGQWPSPILIN